MTPTATPTHPPRPAPVPRPRAAAAPVPHRYDPLFISSAEFARSPSRLDWLVEDLLVRDQPAVLGGPPKCLKTSIIVDLAISVSFGLPFLNRFAVARPGPVAVISGECGQATLRDTVARVAAAKGVDLEAAAVQWSFLLPRLAVPHDLQDLTEHLRLLRPALVVLDPLYLALLAGTSGKSAASLYEVGPLLSDFTGACAAVGATPLLVHHTKKGSGWGNAPAELADLTFSGVAEFARQWLLLSREEPYATGSGLHRLSLAAGGSAGQSGLWQIEVEEGKLGPDFSGRRWQVAVTRGCEKDGAVTPVRKPRR